MRAMDREEEETKAVARDAISRVSACFASDPDEYDVRAAVIWRPPQDDAPDIDVLQFAWETTTGRIMSCWATLSHELSGVSRKLLMRKRRGASWKAWVGPSCRELAEFKSLLGYYQNAFVAALAGREPPPYGLEYLVGPVAGGRGLAGAVLPLRHRGEGAPPIGQVGFILMPWAPPSRSRGASRW